MCGIYGRLSRRGIGVPAADCAAVTTLTHRGPDDGAWWADGPFFLGHRRLAIIDLTSGAQPMASVDGRYVVAFNGEIYNYVELREELRGHGYRFQTSSDTEVLLHGFAAWGTALPERLVGMFAFGLADRLEQSLFLARDRFGEKPLFVADDADGVSFASELKALCVRPGLDLRLDEEGLGGYLTLNYVPGDRTLMASIRRLPPASWRLYHANGQIQEGIYWQPPVQEVKEDSLLPQEAGDRLLGLLDEAVRITLRSDVPVTLLLSGGIDSSVVAARAAHQGVLRHAYCLDFPVQGYSELANAQRVADLLGLELRRVILDPAALGDFLSLVEHADDPLADSSGLAVWTLSRTVAMDYKVAITGDGGDELFAGYLTYPATRLHAGFLARLPSMMRHWLARAAPHIPVGTGKVTLAYKLQRFLRAADLPSSEAHFTWNGTWLPSEAADLVSRPGAAALARSSLTALCERHGIAANPSLLDLQRTDVREYLPNDILAKVDRMTMAHGLESRTPFLNPGIADFALSLPATYKLPRGRQPKWILRQLAARLLGPEIATAKKQGFSIPIHQWLRGPARGLVDDLLSPGSLAALPVLDGGAVIRARDAHLSGRRQFGFEIWGLMVLVAWYRARILAPAVSATCPEGLRRMEFPWAGPGGSA